MERSFAATQSNLQSRENSVWRVAATMLSTISLVESAGNTVVVDRLSSLSRDWKFKSERATYLPFDRYGFRNSKTRLLGEPAKCRA